MVWDFDYLGEKELERIAGYVPAKALEKKKLVPAIQKAMTKKGRTTFQSGVRAEGLARSLIKLRLKAPDPRVEILKEGVYTIRDTVTRGGKKIRLRRFPAGTILNGKKVGGRFAPK